MRVPGPDRGREIEHGHARVPEHDHLYVFGSDADVAIDDHVNVVTYRCIATTATTIPITSSTIPTIIHAAIPFFRGGSE